MIASFGSDNHAPTHPDIIEALINANSGHAPSYGTDPISLNAEKKFKNIFGSQADIYFVFNGTGANIACLKAMLKPWQALICSDVAHINVDECAGPEAIAGVKLIALQSNDGKISAQAIEDCIIRRGDQHFAQIKGVSLTQPTELGTCYSFDELQEIVKVCKKNNLWIHIDGARLNNAAHFLGQSVKSFTTDLGVDLVSYGGTKNGLMMGEAIVVLNQTFAQEMKYIRKQLTQLPSKTRYIGAQFLKYLDIEQSIAAHSHKMALLLASELEQIGIRSEYPVQSNAVFAKIEKTWLKPLREKYFFYVWDERSYVCRIMTHWQISEQDVYGFVTEIKKLKGV